MPKRCTGEAIPAVITVRKLNLQPKIALRRRCLHAPQLYCEFKPAQAISTFMILTKCREQLSMLKFVCLRAFPGRFSITPADVAIISDRLTMIAL